jgi:fibrillarin-like pre-rRNA processing protein
VVIVEPHPTFHEIFWVTFEDGSKRLATKNLAIGHKVYNERLFKSEGVEYRVWDAFRSKLAAAIMKGLKTVPIQLGKKVLYLGAASGTTAGHISDILGENGHIYCVEFAARSIRDLVDNVCVFRINMSPILADARFPERYSVLLEKVEVIYCDVAQPEQAKLLTDNADYFLKDNCWIMLAVKSQSIDVTKKQSEVYAEEANTIKKRGFQIEDFVNLEPYDKAHAMIVAQKIR